MKGNKKICKNYLNGICFYGNKCFYSHDIPNKFNSDFNKNKKPKSSENDSGKLEYLNTIEEHNQNIDNIIALNDSNYLTSDINEFYIRTIGMNNSNKENFEKDSKINKVIYSSGKIIFAVENNNINGNNEKAKSYSLKMAIKINNQIQLVSTNIDKKPYDIYESGNVIIIVGQNFIELYKFVENNNTITKISEINLSNNNDNNDNKLKILCMEAVNKVLVCGHSSGHISFWETTNEYPYLKNTLISKIHIGPINKILFDKNSDNTNIIISCSSDKTVKIHSLEEIVCFNVVNFNDEVVDIKKIKNLKEEINYIISLKDGTLKVFNYELKEIFEIPNRTKVNIARYAINISHSNNNENENNNNKEEYILITEGNKIDLYKWAKKEIYSQNNLNNKNKRKNKYNNQRHKW